VDSPFLLCVTSILTKRQWNYTNRASKTTIIRYFLLLKFTHNIYEKSQQKSLISDLFGQKRALLVGEITHISCVILGNIVGRVLTTGFGQVCKTKEISEYMFRGRDMSSKKIDIFTSVLTSENIPVPSTSYSSVTDSIIPPFSEKLMLFHIVASGLISISNDGMALSECSRSDLSTSFMRFLTEAMNYSKDGADIMIHKNWFEQPPQAIKHENLVRV
ncbi:MAG TPA: DUF3231 family protein, partial [Desulfosporosinus sp.]|nr:DUF3231 family protein [Desulfosporosinus sp.]